MTAVLTGKNASFGECVLYILQEDVRWVLTGACVHAVQGRSTHLLPPRRIKKRTKRKTTKTTKRKTTKRKQKEFARYANLQ